jgi:MSHA biogenesis protein MshO
MNKQRGFTLVELIMVIVLLGIVATISTQFVGYSVQGAIDISDRQQKALKAVVLSERISRELRQAIPGSLELEVDGNCLRFVSSENGGIYKEEFEDGNRVYKPVAPDVDTNDEMVVVASPSGQLTELGDLSSPTDGSPAARFYVVGEVVLYFLDESVSRLYRQSFSDLSSTCSVSDSSTASLLATGIKTGGDPLFNVEAPDLKRNALVNVSFIIQNSDSDNEPLSFSQTLQVRNVP